MTIKKDIAIELAIHEEGSVNFRCFGSSISIDIEVDGKRISLSADDYAAIARGYDSFLDTVKLFSEEA